MEKYKISKYEKQKRRDFKLFLLGKNKNARAECCVTITPNVEYPEFGQNLKIYRDRFYGVADMAIVYRMNGHWCIDFPYTMVMTDIKNFYDKIAGLRQGSFDKLRLKCDVARALISHGKLPLKSGYKNIVTLQRCNNK